MLETDYIGIPSHLSSQAAFVELKYIVQCWALLGVTLPLRCYSLDAGKATILILQDYSLEDNLPILG
jgi:hypothetical protein